MFNKIKRQVRENWKPFIAVAVFAGITCYIMRGRCAILQSGMDGSSRITVRPLLFFPNNPNIVTTIHNGTRGHPGFCVRNLEHMIDFPTQGVAAKTFDISPALLSSHLNGKFDNVNGLHFERVLA